MNDYYPYFFCQYCSECNNFRQQPQTYQIVAPATISAYIGQQVTTYIPGYGTIVVYILGYDPGTQMVRLLRILPGGYQQYMQVSYRDMYSIAPYFGSPMGGAYPPPAGPVPAPAPGGYPPAPGMGGYPSAPPAPGGGGYPIMGGSWGSGL